MRRRSGWAAALLTFTAGVVLTIAGCEPGARTPVAPDDSEVTTEQKVQTLRGRYDWLGDYHTDGLAFVYTKLKENSSRSKRDPACRVAAQAVKEFHRIARRSEAPLTLVDPAIAAETCGETGSQGGIAKNVLVGTPSVRRNDLSAAAVKYLDRIAIAIENATVREELIDQLRAIEYSAVATLPELEAGAVVAVVAIAISSLDYWEQNLDSWGTLDTSMPYSRVAGPRVPASPTALLSSAPPRWWTHPAVRGYLKIVGADATAGGRVLYTTWSAGPVGWDAAAVAAVWGSAMMTLSLLF